MSQDLSLYCVMLALSAVIVCHIKHQLATIHPYQCCLTDQNPAPPLSDSCIYSLVPKSVGSFFAGTLPPALCLSQQTKGSLSQRRKSGGGGRLQQKNS